MAERASGWRRRLEAPPRGARNPSRGRSPSPAAALAADSYQHFYWLMARISSCLASPHGALVLGSAVLYLVYWRLMRAEVVDAEAFDSGHGFPRDVLGTLVAVVTTTAAAVICRLGLEAGVDAGAHVCANAAMAGAQVRSAPQALLV